MLEEMVVLGCVSFFFSFFVLRFNNVGFMLTPEICIKHRFD